MNTEISIEFFPPQTPEGVEKLRAVREKLAVLKPAFFSVTFGAGVAGVASSAVRGAASLTLFIGYEKADGHQLPRLRVGADVDVDAILQFVMFKWTTKAW